jgi:hypothetical protein
MSGNRKIELNRTNLKIHKNHVFFTKTINSNILLQILLKCHPDPLAPPKSGANLASAWRALASAGERLASAWRAPGERWRAPSPVTLGPIWFIKYQNSIKCLTCCFFFCFVFLRFSVFLRFFLKVRKYVAAGQIYK